MFPAAAVCLAGCITIFPWYSQQFTIILLMYTTYEVTMCSCIRHNLIPLNPSKEPFVFVFVVVVVVVVVVVSNSFVID